MKFESDMFKEQVRKRFGEKEAQNSQCKIFKGKTKVGFFEE